MRSRCMVDGKLLIQNWARFTVARRVWTSRAKYEDSILQEHTPVANISRTQPDRLRLASATKRK